MNWENVNQSIRNKYNRLFHREKEIVNEVDGASAVGDNAGKDKIEVYYELPSFLRGNKDCENYLPLDSWFFWLWNPKYDKNEFLIRILGLAISRGIE